MTQLVTSAATPAASSMRSDEDAAAVFERRLSRLTVGWRGLQTFASDQAIHRSGVVFASALFGADCRDAAARVGIGAENVREIPLQ